MTTHGPGHGVGVPARGPGVPDGPRKDYPVERVKLMAEVPGRPFRESVREQGRIRGRLVFAGGEERLAGVLEGWRQADGEGLPLPAGAVVTVIARDMVVAERGIESGAWVQAEGGAVAWARADQMTPVAE